MTAAKELKMLRILCVEDMKIIQDIWKTTFDLLGDNRIECVAVFSIAEAEKAFGDNPNFAAIVMDACVPGREPNTIPLVKKIREAGYKGPMIAVSKEPDYQQMLVEAGCDHMCEKNDLPFNLLKILGVR